MRRYNMTKQNPNPPWPSQQAVLVVPPGSNSTSIGRPDDKIYSKPVQTEFSNLHTRQEEMPIKSNIDGENGVGFLQANIGQKVRAEFMFGNNVHMEKYGTLEGVGKDFLVIGQPEMGQSVMCGMGNMTFIYIYK